MAKIQAHWRLSGGAGNTNPALSLGGDISSTDIVNNTDNNLFNDISITDASTGKTYYRCIYVINNDTTGARNIRAWISSQTPHIGTKVYIGLGTSLLGGTEQSVADEFTAPTGVAFADPISEKSGLYMSDLPFGSHFALWIKLVISPDSSGMVADYGRISIGGEQVVYESAVFADFRMTASSPSPLNNMRFTMLYGEQAEYFLDDVGYSPYESGEDFDVTPINDGDFLTAIVSAPGSVTHFYGNNNAMTGGINDLSSFTNLRVVDVSNNLLDSYGTGIMPAALTVMNFYNNALPVDVVNQILIDCDSVGLGSGFTLTLNGGTNAAPTGDGITAKAALIARGATVTTN